MHVGVVDVGSNTARLLVARIEEDGAVVQLASDRAHLSLGAELARHGALSSTKLAEAADAARCFVEKAGPFELTRCETIVTAPGRGGAGADALVHTLREATGWPVRVLSADEEGRLAFDGAISRAGDLPEVVAVVDVGGGSSEVVVGTPLLGAAWVHSITLGSLRLTERFLADDPPTAKQITAARTAVQRALTIEPPQADHALASGGSARAVARIVGRTFGADELDDVVRMFARRPTRHVARSFEIDQRRASTTAAGAILLAETSQVLGVPLELAGGGLREGAALALAAVEHAAAA